MTNKLSMCCDERFINFYSFSFKWLFLASDLKPSDRQQHFPFVMHGHSSGSSEWNETINQDKNMVYYISPERGKRIKTKRQLFQLKHSKGLVRWYHWKNHPSLPVLLTRLTVLTERKEEKKTDNDHGIKWHCAVW